jgi:GGDEF domain-containing protein/predicted esterase
VRDVDRLVDPATGLSNEWHFEIVLDFVFPIAHRGVTLTLVLFRIDDGDWNANHPKPEQVVTDLGSTLRSVTRSSDIIARFGEDMFICLLPLCNIQGGLVFADRMRDALDDFTTRTNTTVSSAVASTRGGTEKGRHAIWSERSKAPSWRPNPKAATASNSPQTDGMSEAGRRVPIGGVMRSFRAVFVGLVALASSAPGTLGAQSAEDSFEEVYQEFRCGPDHSEDVPTGRMELTRTNHDGLLHRYVVIVPEDYDPSRRYPVAFYLHGGVSRPDPGPGGRWWRNYDVITGHDRIAVVPLSWNESYWWHGSQVENLRGILSDLKRTYNVDENRVVAFGSSDGGTGVYFLGFREVTQWASFLPFIGYPGVLLNPGTGTDGLIHIANLTNKPLFIVSGETDRLYPARLMTGFLESFEEVGVGFVFTVKPGGHNTSWWPEEEDNIERFIEANPRDPHPDRVLWATERTDRYNRAHWIVIDEVGPIAGDEGRSDLAMLTADGRSGIVSAVRADNTVMVDAYHVRRFTVLVSPDEFDLSRPIRMVTNGEVVFEGMVRPSVETLRKWAAVDKDRTMLYAGEITLELEL